MPRTRQEGNRYFSLDVDFFTDRKIKILKARYGADGITIYIYLLCEIYKNGFFLKMDDDFRFIISDDLNMAPEKVMQVMTFLLERSLFNNTLFQSDTVLTSAGIQRRFQLMVKSRALKTPVEVNGRFWLLEEAETAAFIKVRHESDNSTKNGNNSRKNNDISENNDVKEKEKKNIYRYIAAAPDHPFDNADLEQAFQLFLLCRKRNGDLIPDERVTALRNELQSLGDNDRERIAIVNKASASGWKSFYPTQKKTTGRTGSRTGKSQNRFNNFRQRDYDYESLEAKLLKEVANDGEQSK